MSLLVRRKKAYLRRISEATAGLGKTIIRQDLIPPFEVGFIDSAAPLAGNVFPQPLVETSDLTKVLLDDVLSPGFHMIVLAALIDELELEELCFAVSQRSVQVVVVVENSLAEVGERDYVLHVKETTPLIKDYLIRISCIGAIVRPDHYVYCGVLNVKNALGALTFLQSKLQPLN